MAFAELSPSAAMARCSTLLARKTLSLLTETSVEATMPGWSLDTTSSPPLGRLTICA